MEGKSILKKIPEFFIRRHANDPEMYSKALTLFWYTTFWTTAYLLFMGLNIYWGARIGIIYYVVWFPAIIYFWVAIFLHSIKTQGYIISYTASFFTFGLATFQGGFGSPAIVWTFTVVPVASYAFASSKVAIQLTIVGLTELFIIYIAEELGLLYGNAVPPEFRNFNFLNGHFVAGVLVFVFMNLIERDRLRTREIIQKKHEEVLALKEKQDGDYFLTSLLLKPLNRNRSHSKIVQIETLVQQKKQFVFRKKKGEIGGDLCTSHTIQLHGKTYHVFLNGDAMGKSIQGAGGSLVLGAVFEAILQRARLAKDGLEEYPETWLLNAVLELQKVFYSFDGSMYVSLFFGLVDEDTGFMYYINSEHPYTVIYRDSKACFLPGEQILPKIGTPYEMFQKMTINTFTLLQDDQIISGSDGRDDFIVQEDAYGNREINEDETLFLQAVEASNGELARIPQSIQRMGQLSDDLSLICIRYAKEGNSNKQEQFLGTYLTEANKAKSKGDLATAIVELESAYELSPTDITTISLLIRYSLQAHEYYKVVQFCEKYSSLQPADVRYIYLHSICLRKLNKYTLAIKVGERLHKREMADNLRLKIKNIIHLIKLYQIIGNEAKSRELLQEYLLLDSEKRFVAFLQRESLGLQ
ncbi:MAG: PP2C family protein-serine/threonine phosphatase [Spirochaetota bacterium]